MLVDNGDEDTHYTYIKNLSALLSSKINNN